MKASFATTSKGSELSAPVQFPRSRQVSSSTSETAGGNESLSVKPGDLPKKAPSADGQLSVPPRKNSHKLEPVVAPPVEGEEVAVI